MEAARGKPMLALARWSIGRWCAGEPWSEGGPELPATIQRRVDGLFVTLRRDADLRGCIGTVEPQPSLDAALRRFAVQAAGSDPRFPPVTRDELPMLTISLSLLTPAEPIEDPAGIVIGRDGLIVERGGRRGLLLPEVPVEYGWDAERFLSELCRKAFLPPDSWREAETRPYRFGSESFSERDAS